MDSWLFKWLSPSELRGLNHWRWEVQNAFGITGGTIAHKADKHQKESIAHKADKHQKESAWNTEFYVQLLHFITPRSLPLKPKWWFRHTKRINFCYTGLILMGPSCHSQGICECPNVSHNNSFEKWEPLHLLAMTYW